MNSLNYPVVVTGDPMGSPRRQVAMAVLASLGTTLLWAGLPVAYLPIVPSLAVLGMLFAAIRPALVSTVFLTFTYFKLNELSPALEPLGVALSLGSVLMTFSLIWHLLLAQSVRFEWRGPHALVILLWFFISFGLITAQDHSIAFKAWSDYSKTLLLALAMLFFVRTADQVRLLVRLFVIGGFVVGLCAIANALGGVDLVEGTRATAGDATLSNPNDLALILLLPFAFAVLLMLTRGNLFWRFVGGLGVGGIGYAIILTQSRGGLLGMVAVAAIIGSRYVKSKVMLLCFGAFFAVSLYSAMGIADRVSGGAGDKKGESAHERILAWQAGINMARAFPLNGVGIGNFTTLFPRFSPEETLHPYTAHSIWILVLGEVGFPGFVTFLTLVAASIRAGLRNLRRLAMVRASSELQATALATLAGLAGYLVSGSFLSYVYQWPLYVLLILICATSRLADQIERTLASVAGNP